MTFASYFPAVRTRSWNSHSFNKLKEKLLFASDLSYSYSGVSFDLSTHIHQRQILSLAASTAVVLLCFSAKADISSKSILSLVGTPEPIYVGCTWAPLLLTNHQKKPRCHVALCSDTRSAGRQVFWSHLKCSCCLSLASEMILQEQSV